MTAHRGYQPRVHLLQRGRLLRSADGAIIDAHSSVCLIRTARQLILVDTGAPDDAAALVNALDDLGVSPRQIGLVVNTHVHLDHVGCNHLFNRALFCGHRNEEGIRATFAPSGGHLLLDGAVEIDDGVVVVPTPGHSSGSLSVPVRRAASTFAGGETDIVIAGDAIPLRGNAEKGVPPAISWDREAAVASMARIISAADWIVPGHDAPFPVHITRSFTRR